MHCKSCPLQTPPPTSSAMTRSQAKPPLPLGPTATAAHPRKFDYNLRHFVEGPGWEVLTNTIAHL
eukprot:282816-Amphidinium_carterae.1